MKIYIAGKITGLNREETVAKFEKARKMLADVGYSVLVPTILPVLDELKDDDYLHICEAMIDVCDGVYFLSDWKDSPGVRHEMIYAREKGKAICTEEASKNDFNNFR